MGGHRYGCRAALCKRSCIRRPRCVRDSIDRPRTRQAVTVDCDPCCISGRRYNVPMKTGPLPDRRLATMLLIAALGACLAGRYVLAKTSTAIEEIRIAALPAEARAALSRIDAGKPLPYERDGVVFGNRERLLPAKPRGYYHEYTVKTPGERTRGARRIVCGGSIASTAECYYSDDHYQSFRRIMQ